ncbi:MAG: hypothetical protein RMZ41_002705 [Nostoc sp. DedVER02]|uniref:hypothetical protein n=1 Tax=unclassified Nostoc TaxID=2593658 RepID=UPI002AD2C32D|nr:MULTISPECIES: hypothetical protein [unclassified Nostoc]MDZ7986933.1 hypothetical protein [Nostoc sp. DedVER02]MDZ8116451.1 hypothetical protein [Nostoc sp. DedVER01b]
MKKLDIFPFLSQKISNFSRALIARISSTILLDKHIHAATLGQNLIINGDAEQGQGRKVAHYLV